MGAAARFQWDDPLDLENQITDTERTMRDTARRYAQSALLPRVIEAYRTETFDREILREMGSLGLLGAMLPERYGCPEVGHVGYGLMAREIERVDSG